MAKHVGTNTYLASHEVFQSTVGCLSLVKIFMPSLAYIFDGSDIDLLYCKVGPLYTSDKQCYNPYKGLING